MRDNINERRAYIKSLLDNGEAFEVREVAKMFSSSFPAVMNDISVVQGGGSYYRKLPGMGIASVENNRAHKRGLDGKITRDEWVAVYERNGNKCANCHKQKPLTMDHIQPLSKGGLHCIENIQPLCKSCNSQKKDRW